MNHPAQDGPSRMPGSGWKKARGCRGGATNRRRSWPNLHDTDALVSQGMHAAAAIEISRGRVERTWRRDGLRVPQNQPKRHHLWLNDDSCVRLRPKNTGHVWSCDSVADQTRDSRPLQMMTEVDENSQESLPIVPGRTLGSDDLIGVVTDLFVERGARGASAQTTDRNPARMQCGLARGSTLAHRAGQPVGNGCKGSSATGSCATSCRTGRPSTCWRRQTCTSRTGG